MHEFRQLSIRHRSARDLFRMRTTDHGGKGINFLGHLII
jgi:hypothetical protein